jgi:membrane-associated protease RseP (regulator of RpoE activity)
MRSAIFVVTLIGTAVVPSLNAQTTSSSGNRSTISILTNDTLVKIENGDKSSCVVTIDGRKPSKSVADKICDRQLKDVRFFGNDAGTLSLQLQKLRGVIGDGSVMDPESLITLQGQQLELAKLLQSQSITLREEGTNFAGLLRRSEAPNVMLDRYMTTQIGGRTIIGVTVDAQPRDTDRHGAFVVGVTPKGPAEQAGIKVNDVISKVDGQSVAGRTERAADDGESSTWIKLTEIVGNLDADKSVSLEYRRDGQSKKTTIKPTKDNRHAVRLFAPEGRVENYTFGQNGGSVFTVRPPSGEPSESKFFGQLAPFASPDAPEPMVFEYGPMGKAQFSFGRFSDLELSAINDKLGAYFGTSDGVLVVDVRDDEQQLGLEPGDVVLSIDGRTVDTPSTMLRILRSYEPGESVSLKIMRDKRPLTLSRTLP